MTAARSTVSVIIPTLNEEKCVEAMLRNIVILGPDEVIVADGGSEDGTREIASRYAHVVQAPRGRGSQMNAAAAAANSEILLFLHADVRLDVGVLEAIREVMMRGGIVGGCLDIVYEGGDRSARAFTVFGRLRRRLGIVYGDSGIFCHRKAFERLGGYKQWPIMEDYEFYRRLRRCGRPVLLDEKICVSDRRWRGGGLLNALWNWFRIQGLYWLGVSPNRLARMYRDVR